MAKVTQRSRPKVGDLKHAECAAERASVATDASLQVRSIPQKKYQSRAHQRQNRRHLNHGLPGQAGAHSAHPIRQCSTQGQHSHQQTQGRPRLVADPANNHLHAQRVDARQAKTHGKTKC